MLDGSRVVIPQNQHRWLSQLVKQGAPPNRTCTKLNLVMSRYLLLAAAVSMGSVAIWSMHFIGNRAISMAHNAAGFQIEYSQGFTAGSFFLPICGVGVAFYFFSISENVGIGGTMTGGLMLGMAICG